MADDLTLEEVVRYGSVLLPVADAWPSTAINFAVFDPRENEVAITFHSGDTITAPCSVATWAAYKASPSRGQFFNRVFKKS